MKRIARHVFAPSPDVPETCRRCPLPEGNTVHHLPEVDEQVRAAEMRRMGERGEAD